MPPAAMAMVTGKWTRMPEATLELGTLAGVNREWPRFPRRAWLSHSQYWAKKPSFRCSCRRMWATVEALAWIPPARVRAGSPGRISTRLNTASEMTISRGTVIRTRRTTNESNDPPDAMKRNSGHFLM